MLFQFNLTRLTRRAALFSGVALILLVVVGAGKQAVNHADTDMAPGTATNAGSDQLPLTQTIGVKTYPLDKFWASKLLLIHVGNFANSKEEPSSRGVMGIV